MNVGSLGKSIAKVDFWTTHDAPWSHGSQITDAGNSPPRVRMGPHASALGGGLGLWVPTNNFTTKRGSVRPHPDPRRAVPRIRNLRSVRPWGVVGGPEVDFCY